MLHVHILVDKAYEIVKDMVVNVLQTVLIPDGKGNYPLHIAIHNQNSYQIIREMFRANLDIGTMLNIKTSLLPFMIAAIGA